MIKLASQNNPNADLQVMDCRNVNKLQTTFDGIVCGFCLPYLSTKDCEKLISDSDVLLNDNGLIYLSFVESNAGNSGFKVGSSGDRTFFYYHKLDTIQTNLIENNFSELKVSLIEYIRSGNDKEMHTIVTARKKKSVK